MALKSIADPLNTALVIEAISPSKEVKQVVLDNVNLERNKVKVIKERANDVFIKKHGFSTQNRTLLYLETMTLLDNYSISQQCPDYKNDKPLLLTPVVTTLQIEATSPSKETQQIRLVNINLEWDTVKVIKERANDVFTKEHGFSTQNRKLLYLGTMPLQDDFSLSQQCPDYKSDEPLRLIIGKENNEQLVDQENNESCVIL